VEKRSDVLKRTSLQKQVTLKEQETYKPKMIKLGAGNDAGRTLHISAPTTGMEGGENKHADQRSAVGGRQRCTSCLYREDRNVWWLGAIVN
jgi:hypothetical protein